MRDEPALGPDFQEEPSSGASSDSPLAERIKQLVHSQPFAVLCTQGHEQPYGSVVAFAIAEDLTAAVFATPVTTRKFQLLSECDRVALLIDNRCQHSDNMMEVEAVTATGRAVRIQAGKEFEEWSRRLVSRHHYLAGFVHSPTVALFRVDVVRYFHVVRFQEVQQWKPSPAHS